jgi:hypothetical protein
MTAHGHSGMTAAAFGSVAGVTALFYLSGVPRVQKDILQVFSPQGSSNPSQSTTNVTRELPFQQGRSFAIYLPCKVVRT